MATLGRWAYRDWALGLVDRLSCRLGNFWAICGKPFLRLVSSVCVCFPFCPGRGGGALGYFLGGCVPPGTPNWHPVLKKFPLRLIPHSTNRPIFYTPF